MLCVMQREDIGAGQELLISPAKMQHGTVDGPQKEAITESSFNLVKNKLENTAGFHFPLLLPRKCVFFIGCETAIPHLCHLKETRLKVRHHANYSKTQNQENTLKSKKHS